MVKVRDLIAGRPITVQATEKIANAARIMRDCDVGALPVMVDDRLAGILTDRDIVVRALASGLNLDQHEVQEIMSLEPATTTAGTETEKALELMADFKIRRLPVVQDGKLVGLISLGDIAVGQKGDEELTGQVLEHISEPIGPKCAR